MTVSNIDQYWHNNNFVHKIIWLSNFLKKHAAPYMIDVCLYMRIKDLHFKNALLLPCWKSVEETHLST